MNFKDQLFIIKNRLFEKRNIILIVVLTIIFLILFSCLTIIEMSVENKNETLNSEVARTYYIYSDENRKDLINSISNIEHVEFILSNKYHSLSIFEIPEFDKGNEKGIIYIKPLHKDYDVKIKKGTSLKKKYDIVCSDTFYPHEFDERIYKDLFLSRDEFLNKSINVISNNEDLKKKEITLNIVGTYKNRYEDEANTCYTSLETYDEISGKYPGFTESYDENGNLISKEHMEYEGYIMRIDSNKNKEEVLNKLKDMNVEFDKMYFIESTFLNMLYFIPLFISIIVIILTLNILYNFISKKINNRIHNIGVLRAIGYDEKSIMSLNINENIFVILISAFISLCIYFIVLNNLKYTLLAEITYNNYILNIPYILIFLSLILFIFIIIKIVKLKVKKIFNLSIQSLLEK